MTQRIQSGIYAILNLLNGKRYVGSAVNLKGRRQIHFRNLRKGIHKNSHLQNAFKKYGENAFGWVILEYVENLEMLLSQEDLYLRIYWSSRLLYNTCPVAGSMLGYRHTEKSKRKMSKAHTGERHYMYGKHHSTETKQKQSRAHKGKCPSAETRRRLSLAMTGERHPMYGKHHTAESKRKNSRSHKGLQCGKQNPFYGKCHTAEAKHKISIARKKWWAQRKQQNGDTTIL